jgi:hypothetical protein
MSTLWVIGFFIGFIYLLIQFARQENVQDEYEDVIVDVEGRLDWARTRSVFPFGMKAQLEVCGSLLERAKALWNQNKWHQAYRVLLQSQEAMNRAQHIYSSVLTGRAQSNHG